MEALKIVDSYRQELSNKTIIICTYYELPNMNEVDCIDIIYQSEYPQFDVVNVTTGDEPLSGSTENYL